MNCSNKGFKFISIFLVSLLVLSTLSGCGKKQPAAAGSSDTGAGIKVTYPMKTNVALKYWWNWSNQYAKSLNEAPIAKELQKKTGIKVTYINPGASTAGDAFNLMLASGDLPDIIEWNWAGFPGGPEKAMNDGYIIKLNDIINKYAPNLKAYYAANPDREKMVKTDSGNFYNFPFFREDEMQLAWYGPIMRQDWLDDLGLQVPTTMDEWHDTLKAFKEKKGATAPLTVDSGLWYFQVGAFAGAYGVKKDFYLENGKVTYGPIQPGYKEFLAAMKEWYSEGLLDKNFSTSDGKIVNANMTSGKSGASLGGSGGGLGAWMQTMKDKDPKYKLVGTPYPVLNKGDRAKFGQRDPYGNSDGAAITTKCKNVEIAARYLDYPYSKEGHMVANFGIEGESYKMVNGEPQYTDIITNNPNKLTRTDALNLYTLIRGSGPAEQDKRLVQCESGSPEQLAAKNNWKNTDQAKHDIQYICFTQQESSDMAKIMADVNTLVNEMTIKFIMGTTPLDDFDKFVKQIKDFGIDKAISIEQAAVDRYNKR